MASIPNNVLNVLAGRNIVTSLMDTPPLTQLNARCFQIIEVFNPPKDWFTVRQSSLSSSDD